jgi:beta-barrel assembly-enhancing protease
MLQAMAKVTIARLILSLALFAGLSGSLFGRPKNFDLENIGRRNVNAGQLNFFSIEREIAVGRELAVEVERTSRILNDREVSEYVNRLAQNIVRNSDAQVPFVVKVIDSDEINAFALPGGFFYVNTGLVLAAQEESELAGVIAHEIAHVAARHATEQFSKYRLFNLASIPLVFVGGPVGYGIHQAMSILIPLQFLQFSRGSEREADFLGLQYVYKTGYDPVSFVSFFEKASAQEKRAPGFLSRTFSTHPMSKDRISLAQREIQSLLPSNETYVINTSEFDRIKTRLRLLQRNIREKEEQSGRPQLKISSHSVEEINGDDSLPTDETPRLIRTQ